MTIKKRFKAAAVLSGWAMIIAGLILLVALVIDIAWHVMARESPVFHASLWGVFFGLQMLGVLLVQTGEMAEALETLSERLPGIAGLIKSVWPGGRRATDPPVVPPVAPTPIPPPIPPPTSGKEGE